MGAPVPCIVYIDPPCFGLRTFSVGIQQEGKRLQKSFQYLENDNSNDKVSLYSCVLPLCVHIYS